jgi:hypothetical protein
MKRVLLLERMVLMLGMGSSGTYMKRWYWFSSRSRKLCMRGDSGYRSHQNCHKAMAIGVELRGYAEVLFCSPAIKSLSIHKSFPLTEMAWQYVCKPVFLTFLS